VAILPWRGIARERKQTIPNIHIGQYIRVVTTTELCEVDCVWNVMAHAQKPDFVFRQSGWVHLNRWGRQFSRLLAGKLYTSACRVCIARASLCSAVTWRLLVTHSILLFALHYTNPCVTVCHHISNAVYKTNGRVPQYCGTQKAIHAKMSTLISTFGKQSWTTWIFIFLNTQLCELLFNYLCTPR
jgi:hypothetical protein